MLHHLIPNSILTGNDRGTKPILLNIENLDPNQWIILEISNRQLDQIQASPHIAVLLNITENHLDEYDSIQDYINTKAKIFQFQKPEDHCFLNQDDSNTAQLFSQTKSQLHPYSLNIQDQKLIVKDLQVSLADLPIQGNHNLSNLTVALQVAQQIGIPNDQLIQLVKTFQPLKDRQQPIRTIGNTTYYNDRQGTSIHATIQALEALPKPLVLILGGQNKHMPTQQLADSISKNCQLTVGIKSPFVDELQPLIQNLEQVYTMTEAVQLASKQNAKTVIFSPACSYAPYFMHQNKPDYLDFTKIVNSL
jgi:UDP-N-acetylmuramoylalanine--D-glutamate ligase